jgi:hypothetical protein
MEMAARAIAVADSNDRHPSLKRSPVDLWENGPRDLYVKFAQAAITAFLEQKKAEGFALMPREATDEMIRAGDSGYREPELVWERMWNAAPDASTGG